MILSGNTSDAFQVSPLAGWLVGCELVNVLTIIRRGRATWWDRERERELWRVEIVWEVGLGSPACQVRSLWWNTCCKEIETLFQPFGAFNVFQIPQHKCQVAIPHRPKCSRPAPKMCFQILLYAKRNGSPQYILHRFSYSSARLFHASQFSFVLISCTI